MKRYAVIIILALLTIAAVQTVIVTAHPQKEPGIVCYTIGQSALECPFNPALATLQAGTATSTIAPRSTSTPTPTATETKLPSRTPSPIASVTALPPFLINGDFEQPNNAAWTFFNMWRDTPSTNDERGDAGTRIDGAQSFRIWNSFRCIMAGVYQRVVVAPFTTLEFSAWGRTWASEGVFPGGHDPNVYDAIAVGIDPSGGTSPESTGVLWNENFSTDNGKRVFIRATALSSQVTVFIRVRVGVVDPNGTACQWPHTHMMGFIDGARLDVVP